MTGQHLRDLPGFLRAPRSAALWLVGVGITVASLVAYVLSYAGLAQWALHHGWPPAGAVWFPFLIDLPLVVCEVILFVAAIDGGTPWRVRALAWLVLLAFTTASTVGNADHLATATPLTRGGFALPPLVLAIVLGFGLGELKRQAAKYRNVPAAVPAAVPAQRRLPRFQEIQDRHHCGQRAAEVARAEVQLDRRGRGGLMHPAPVPAAHDRSRGDPIPSRPGSAPAAHERSRDGSLPQRPRAVPAAQDGPAGVPATGIAPAPAGSPNGSGPRG